MTTRTARITTALLGGTAALITLAAPAAAAPSTTTGRVDVTAQRLVLDPTDRGYVGTLTATVTNRRSTATSFSLVVTEPAGASFTSIEPGGGCFYTRLVENRLVINCGANQIEARKRLTFRLGFHVWTTARSYPMVANGGRIEVVPDGAAAASDATGFTTLFRSTTGSLRKPRPYVQAVDTDLSIRGSAVTLTPQPDGTLLGRMPVTVRYGNDAPTFAVDVAAALPAGVQVDHIEPQDMPSFPLGFTVPGGRFMPGEERTFDVFLRAPAGTAAGELGIGTFTVKGNYFWGAADPQDVDPSDNTTSFTVTAVAAS
ncbi:MULTISPECIES: hypothetical protein [unclassified Micromonospora]|uniref:hypothetical protein n=1 Tax=unclassified Micromonospora TaxID=2617518 RepID=UPI001C250E08|nr:MULTISPECIES: hypothetical protein [unclassified Micromonospora]MBU8857183.1 hypothetical protein [Micromonospora sp. WMMB482]MDM4782803.1 hypothetical protein [Micromonospora sp. b486]